MENSTAPAPPLPLLDPGCHRCAGRGVVRSYPLYPQPGDTNTEPCPRCYPPDYPACEPDPEPRSGSYLAIYHGPGQWEIPSTHPQP
jgi:hypothetical protein